jgi:hypothetical protein
MATHIVRSGDYPWKLAVEYVKDGNRWRELCAANPQLAKHATYGCVFPKVGTAINLPDSWVPASATLTATPSSATISTSSGISDQLATLFGLKPSTTTVSMVTTGQQTTVTADSIPSAANAATAAATTPPGTAPVASQTVVSQPVQSSVMSAAISSSQYIKIGLLAAGIIAAGFIVYQGISSKEGAGSEPPKTVKMKTNTRRGKGKRSARRASKRRMRRNGKTMTKEMAVREFVIDNRGKFAGDKPGVREAWNNWVDHLQKSGEITEGQASRWDQPKFVQEGKMPGWGKTR